MPGKRQCSDSGSGGRRRHTYRLNLDPHVITMIESTKSIIATPAAVSIGKTATSHDRSTFEHGVEGYEKEYEQSHDTLVPAPLGIEPVMVKC